MRTRTRRLITAASALLLVVLSAGTLLAQTPFVPYFGKNRIKYDNFQWQIYTTDHFEIYYYPEIEPHLERIAGYAESAYQHVSSELKHDLAFKVPLILFSTSSEFWISSGSDQGASSVERARSVAQKATVTKGSRTNTARSDGRVQAPGSKAMNATGNATAAPMPVPKHAVPASSSAHHQQAWRVDGNAPAAARRTRGSRTRACR